MRGDSSFPDTIAFFAQHTYDSGSESALEDNSTLSVSFLPSNFVKTMPFKQTGGDGWWDTQAVFFPPMAAQSIEEGIIRCRDFESDTLPRLPTTLKVLITIYPLPIQPPGHFFHNPLALTTYLQSLDSLPDATSLQVVEYKHLLQFDDVLRSYFAFNTDTAAPNSRVRALLGPKVMAFVQGTLPFSITPDHENLEPPLELLQAMKNLSLDESAGEQDVTMCVDLELMDAPDLAEASSDVTSGQ